MAADDSQKRRRPVPTPIPPPGTLSPAARRPLASAGLTAGGGGSKPRVRPDVSKKSRPKPEKEFDRTRLDAGWAATAEAIHAIDCRDAASRVVGLPLPALCLDYLFQANILPLGRFIQLIGLPGASKSSTLFEFQRWVMLHDGYALTEETEQKDIPIQRAAVWEHNPKFLAKNGPAKLVFANSMEHWQAILTKTTRSLQKQNEGEIRELLDGIPKDPVKFGPKQRKELPLWRYPYAIGIDSLMAVGPTKQLEQQLKDGHAVSDYARAAGLLARYMQQLPHMLRDTSIVVIGTNHNKPSVDFFGNPVNQAPGGRALKFMETIEIVMNRGASLIQPLGGGVSLSMSTIKNSLGESGITIHVPKLWLKVQDPETGQWRQYTYFDWASATSQFLVALESRRNGKALWKAVNEIVDIRSASKTRLWSKRLGIAESDAVTYHEFGTLIDSNLPLRRTLWPLLGISEYSLFVPGQNIWDTFDNPDQERDHQLPSRYPVRDLSGFGQLASTVLSRRPDADALAGTEQNGDTSDDGEEDVAE